MPRPQFWVIKASLESVWKFHWNDYFERDDDPLEWGSDCIGSKTSKKLLREDIQVNDIALCYQVDDKAIWALSQFESIEKANDKEDFALCHHSKAFQLTKPLYIDELRNNRCDPESFQQGGYGHGTIGPISQGEFLGIIQTIRDLLPDQWDELHEWLLHAGIERIGMKGYLSALLEADV